MIEAKFLLDVNVLVALTDKNHIHHETVARWFDAHRKASWGVCPFTEAGFLRAVTRPAIGGLSIEEATEILIRLAALPGYMFWSIPYPWTDLAAPLGDRIFGHQQITDACLLGLAIKENGVLVTLDKAITHLAGARFAQNLLQLE
ncbi:MAG: TA system VapC family ribonuclease toxin [Terracidiphilus sp.]